MQKDPIDRVDARAKVTGTATYAAEYKASNVAYGFLVGSTITKGTIKTIDTKAAERAPGVIAVLTYINAPKVPGHEANPDDPSKEPTENRPLKIFHDNKIAYYDQPIALVIADTYERVRHAATLVKATYEKTQHHTDLDADAVNAKKASGPDMKDYIRGEEDAYKKAEVFIEVKYEQPIEVHSPIELGSIIARWDAHDKVTVYTKTQGVQDTQQAVSDMFKLKKENVTVHAEFIGGSFGMALRTWPYEVAAIVGAKKINRPLKIVIPREQMFTNVGSRPAAIQSIGMGTTKEGKITGITHEAIAHTSSYEEFTEGIFSITKMLYACANMTGRYRLVPLNTCTPIWMRGPGEATGSYALESAMDEMAYKLQMDPIEFRKLNHADRDPDSKLPWSTKYLKECYDAGMEKIGWKNRSKEPAGIREGDWLIGYGMGTGVFGSFRWGASVKAVVDNSGILLLQCSVNDMGPGVATMMTKIASDTMGIPVKQIKIEMGSTGLPPGPTQGGSATTANVGTAVHEVCNEIKGKIAEMVSKEGSVFHTSSIHNVAAEDLVFADGYISYAKDPRIKVTYADLFRQNNLPELAITKESKAGGPNADKYSKYSFSVHFVKLSVNALTGMVKINKVVSCGDAGTIINFKTAASQMIGGAVGGIGMALMEELVIDQRYGKIINNNLADYHVPVNADIPEMEVVFINKKDPYTNPMGSKGLGEIALVGMAPAITNAIFNATGKRIRELPVTPDKLI
ncbi:MAG TPA: xanthine dehydrogenase family protein molybdopterin-binding subunit [Flavitalea sp.]|nr:xanthine dehydrogenase family protein molybdopterin-binding subunit [Flavitalea sp.]